MGKTLNDLWCSYLSDASPDQSREMKKIYSRALSEKEKFSTDFTEEQKKAMNKYEELCGEISALCEREAFLRGVRFTATFLLEALCEG